MIITTIINPVQTPASKISAIALQDVKTVDSKTRSNRLRLYLFFMEIKIKLKHREQRHSLSTEKHKGDASIAWYGNPENH